jgi:hypothetical protein
MVNEAIAANGRLSSFKPKLEHQGPFDIVEHDQHVKLNQRRTYMVEIQYCMLVRVVAWVDYVGRISLQRLNARVAFTWKQTILRQILQDIIMCCGGVVGNE